MYRTLLAILMLAALAACSTPQLQGTVTRFHVLSSVSQSFAVVPSPEQRGSLEFQSYANLVRSELTARGWNEVPFDAADVAVFLQYQISQGRQVTFSYPILGQVPTGSSTTTGTISTYGNTSTLNTTTTGQSTLGVVGSGTGSRVEFDRAVRLVMYSMAAYRSTQEMASVYEGEIRFSGSTGELPTLMPVLVRGLFEDFPGVSGSTRRVNVPFE